jgi:ornithine cyclodeaminase
MPDSAGEADAGRVTLTVVSGSEIRSLLSVDRSIEAVERALRELTTGEIVQPLRTILTPQGAPGAMAWMPVYRSGERRAFGMKLLCVLPGNPKIGLDSHQGVVVLFDGATGSPEAVLDASAITALRTAGVSALATRELARPGASILAIIGTGVQARSHLPALAAVRDLERVLVVGRTIDAARAYATEMSGAVSCPVEAAASGEEAVRAADIVTTVTSATEPVLARDWLPPGTHLNVVGLSAPTAREINGDTVAACALFCERRESVENEAPEYRRALDEGAIGPDHIRAELGEVLLGRAAGRTSDDEITLFRSLGLACEDLVTAQEVLALARAQGVGRQVPL